MKRLTKKQVGMVVAAVLLLGAGGTYAYAQQSTKKLEETKEQLLLSTTKLEKTYAEIEALLDKKDPNYLVKDVKEETIVALKAKVKEEILFLPEVELEEAAYQSFNKESKKVQELMNKVNIAYQTQVGMNKLYQKMAINGPEVKKDLAIVDDLKSETVKQAKKEFFKEGATAAYDKTINALVSNAENQLNQIDTAKAAVVKVYKDNKVLSTDTKLYDTAKAETEKIKNVKAKKVLTDQLGKVKAAIDKKIAEESKKQAETKEAASADPVQQQNVAGGAAQTESAGTVDQTNQNAAEASAGTSSGADTGAYVPQGDNSGGYQQPQSPAPVQEQPQAPATDGQAQNPPASTGGGSGSNTIVVNPEDVQGTSDNSNSGGSNWWSGF